MSEVPEDLKYAETHEWVRVEKDGTVTVGITDHAQEKLGDLVFVELPNEGDQFNAEDTSGVLESVKAASDVLSPIAGDVIESNTALTDEPGLVNRSPYGDGWLFKLKQAKDSGLESLLTAEQYREFLANEE
jgi:glycine cleavage system H protein